MQAKKLKKSYKSKMKRVPGYYFFYAVAVFMSVESTLLLIKGSYLLGGVLFLISTAALLEFSKKKRAARK